MEVSGDGRYRQSVSYRWYALVFGIFLVAACVGVAVGGLSDGEPVVAMLAAPLAFLAWIVVRPALSSLTLGPAGIEVRNWPRRQDFGWTDVTELRRSWWGDYCLQTYAREIKLLALRPTGVFWNLQEASAAAEVISARAAGPPKTT